MLVARRLAFVVAAVFLCAGSLPAAVLAPGTLYALVYDFSTDVEMERVVTIDPATGLLSPIGDPIEDCCLVGGFPVYALDANTGGFYAAGYLKSDSDGDRRLLGFDAVTGVLASTPFLTGGTYNDNLFKLDIGTGIVWGLVYDLGAAEEQVVIVSPANADLTAVGNTIDDCCTIGGFNVSAFNPANGRLYVAGSGFSDPPGSKRLLGFDALTGDLVSSPYLSAAWQYNDFEMDPLTGTLYGIAYDLVSKEYVVTIDPTTGTVTPVGTGIANCCTVSDFNAYNPYTGKLYIKGNLLSDPLGSLPRLLGFDVATGTLATSPVLPNGWNFNVLQVAVTPTANQPPEAVCQDVEVTAAPGQCGADASIDGGSFDPDSDPLLISQDPSGPYLPGDTTVTLFVFDGQDSDSCQATVTVIDEDDSPPVISCNSPATITPPEAPLLFTATAVGACAPASATITGYSCWKPGGGGSQHPAGCKVNIDGSTIEIENTGGVGTHIEWTVESGGQTAQCSVVVANPGQS